MPPQNMAVEVQDMPPRNTPLCCIGYWELWALHTQHMRGGAFSELPRPAYGQTLQEDLGCHGSPAPELYEPDKTDSSRERGRLVDTTQTLSQAVLPLSCSKGLSGFP